MISNRANAIQPSATLAISAKAKEMKANGIDVIGFGAGEPDFDVPENVKNAAKKAVDDKDSSKYSPASGLLELKKAIVAKFKRENNLEYTTDEVIISNGGKHNLITIFLALINPGDEVLLPNPYWVSYADQIGLCDGKIVSCNGFSDIKNKINEKTKILVLNSPCNPSGEIIEEEEMKKIAELCIKNDVIVVSDEVYEHFLYDGKKHISIATLPGMKQRTITANAVSKTYSMPGYRVGYCAGPVNIIKAMNKLQSHMTSNVCNIAQKAAIEALNGQQESVKEMQKEFDKRRKYMVERLNNMKGIKCKMPLGAFYAFPDISETKMNSAEFCEKLLEQAKVAVVPGIAFGDDNCIRISYAVSIEDIEKGMKRMEEFCGKI